MWWPFMIFAFDRHPHKYSFVYITCPISFKRHPLARGSSWVQICKSLSLHLHRRQRVLMGSFLCLVNCHWWCPTLHVTPLNCQIYTVVTRCKAIEHSVPQQNNIFYHSHALGSPVYEWIIIVEISSAISSPLAHQSLLLPGWQYRIHSGFTMESARRRLVVIFYTIREYTQGLLFTTLPITCRSVGFDICTNK